MVYRWLALAVVGLHFAYLGYLVAGGYVAWRWPRTFGLHLLAVAWAVLIVAAAVPCPLTWAQNALRTLGGEPRLGTSFIDTYVTGVFYPTHDEVAARVLVALVVLVSWVGLAVRRARRPARVGG